jgi:hypothetical protein
MPTGESLAISYLKEYVVESDAKRNKIVKLFKGKDYDQYESVVEEWIREEIQKRKSKDILVQIALRNILEDFGMEDFSYYYKDIDKIIGKESNE